LAGGFTIVEAYVCERQRRGRVMFLPLYHAPGTRRAAFGEALVAGQSGDSSAIPKRLRR
jgi:hypothetical protein